MTALKNGGSAWRAPLVCSAALIVAGCTANTDVSALCEDWCDVWVVCWPAAENMGSSCEYAYPDGLQAARQDCYDACVFAREGLSDRDAGTADLCFESLIEFFPECSRSDAFTWLERCVDRSGTNGAFASSFLAAARYTELECR